MQAEKENSFSKSLMNDLSGILNSYLQENPRRSLYGLSQRCKTSEPTLRRILRGKIKTLPNPNTVIDVLSTISGESNLAKLTETYPGPIASYLKAVAPIFEDKSMSAHTL